MGSSIDVDVVSEIRNRVTEKDLETNSTLHSVHQLRTPLEELYNDRHNINSIVDIGCGYGGFASALGELTGASNVYGIDTNDEKRSVATERGLKTYDIDVESEPLPFDSDSVDLVICFGLIEHIQYYDHLFEDVKRVVRDNGWFWLATPNLGGWTNRLALLFGYQPRNIEISAQEAFGILPMYEYTEFLGHVHAPTYRALRELLDYYSLPITTVTPLAPYQQSNIVRILDATVGRLPHFSRRIAALCRV